MSLPVILNRILPCHDTRRTVQATSNDGAIGPHLHPQSHTGNGEGAESGGEQIHRAANRGVVSSTDIRGDAHPATKDQVENDRAVRTEDLNADTMTRRDGDQAGGRMKTKNLSLNAVISQAPNQHLDGENTKNIICWSL